jgi:hypothetical protein
MRWNPDVTPAVGMLSGVTTIGLAQLQSWVAFLASLATLLIAVGSLINIAITLTRNIRATWRGEATKPVPPMPEQRKE